MVLGHGLQTDAHRRFAIGCDRHKKVYVTITIGYMGDFSYLCRQYEMRHVVPYVNRIDD